MDPAQSGLQKQHEQSTRLSSAVSPDTMWKGTESTDLAVLEIYCKSGYNSQGAVQAPFQDLRPSVMLFKDALLLPLQFWL